MAISMMICVILISFCLVQESSASDMHSLARREATSNPVLAAINASVVSINNLGENIVKTINIGNALVKNYIDNTTDYGAAFKINIFTEISNIVATHNKAIAEAESIAKSSNRNIGACLSAKAAEGQALALGVIQEIVKCVVTKVDQFRYLSVKLLEYGTNAITFIPSRIIKVKSCDSEGSEYFQLLCVTNANMKSVAEMVTWGVGVASTVATATSIYTSLTADLKLCAASKVFGFRQTIHELSLTTGSCTMKSIFG